MAKVYGTGIIKIGGTDYGTKPGFDLDLGGVERDDDFASGIRQGTWDKPSAAKITGLHVVVKSTTDLEKLRNFDGGDVEWISDVGHHYVFPNATMSKPPKPMDGGRGAQLEMSADPGKKVKGP